MAYSGPYGSFRESTGRTTKGDAQAALTDRIAKLQSGTATVGSHKTRVSDLYALVERDYTNDGQKSVEDLKARWRLHLDPFFGAMRAAAVTANVVEDYKSKRLKAGASNATVNRELAVLRRGFRLGEHFGKVSRVPHFAMLAESKPRSGFLDESQYTALIEACAAAKHAPWLRGFVEVAGQLSNRRGELLNLRVRHVDFLGESITLEETKNGERRTIPMTPSVHALLKAACVGKAPDAYVFTWPDGRQVRDFRETWSQVTAAAGVPWLKVHDLRRTGVRNMIRRGISEQVAMQISGHKTREVFRRYNITSADDLRNAARLIEAGRSQSQCTDVVQSESDTRKAAIN
jgi:integrase